MLTVAGRPVSTELLEYLGQMARDCSRRQLAYHLCQQMDWRSPGGGLPLMAARLALNQLAEQGHLSLPPPKPSPQRAPKGEGSAPAGAASALECSLAELGELDIILVDQGGS